MSSTYHFANCLLFTLFLLLIVQRAQAAHRQHIRYQVHTECVVRAFGSGLQGKGISVTFREIGAGCDNMYPWKWVTKSAVFDSTGKAVVKINLPVNIYSVCMADMVIKATFDYNCYAVERTIGDADWGKLAKHGSCRALEQLCGRQTSIAAVPYIDMWCRRPTTHPTNPDKFEEMKLRWHRDHPNDKC